MGRARRGGLRGEQEATKEQKVQGPSRLGEGGDLVGVGRRGSRRARGAGPPPGIIREPQASKDAFVNDNLYRGVLQNCSNIHLGKQLGIGKV